MRISRLWIAACTLVCVGASLAQAQALKLLPNDTELVVVLNLQQILKSEALKAEEAKLLVAFIKGKITQDLEDKMFDKHLKAAGFDPFKDLSSITLAVPGGRPPQEGFIVIEGRFDAQKIEDAATEATKGTGGFKVITIANVKAFEVTPKEDKKMYVGILDKKTMILCANKNDFIDAVARHSGTKKTAFTAVEFKSLIGNVTPNQSISVVGTRNGFEKFAEALPQGEQAKAAVGIFEGLSVAITLQKNLDIVVGAYAKDNESASKYAALASAFIKGARAQAEEKSKEDERAKLAVDILRTVTATATGSNMTIRGQITYEVLGQILKQLPLPQ